MSGRIPLRMDSGKAFFESLGRILGADGALATSPLSGLTQAFSSTASDQDQNQNQNQAQPEPQSAPSANAAQGSKVGKAYIYGERNGRVVECHVC